MRLNQKVMLFGLLIIVFNFNQLCYAQNIDAIIGSSELTSSFQVLNSEGDSLIIIGSTGFVQIASPPDSTLSSYNNKPVQFNTSEFLLYVNGYKSYRPDFRNIYMMSGKDIILDTPSSTNNTINGGKIEVLSGISGGGINILGGGEEDGNGGSGEIKIQPGENKDLNLYGGGYSNQAFTGGDINIEASKGGRKGDVNILSGEGYLNGAGNIHLVGANTVEGNGGSIIITPGISTSGSIHDEDGLVEINGSGIYSGTWTQASDKRFKKNITPIEDPTEKLNMLEPVTYELRKEKFPNRRFEEGEQIGLIAQDVEKLFPQLVKDDVDGYKTVDYTKLSVIAIEAIKNQQKEIDQQRSEIEELKKIINKILIESSQVSLGEKDE